MGISASDLSGAIDRLASELLSQAESNPAITITDHAKALDYFRARAMANEAESKSTAKPPQRDRPPTLGKLPMIAEIIRTWPGARFVQFIDE
jgi:hypothetical protein